MTPSGIKPATFRFVAQHLNHCATATTNLRSVILQNSEDLIYTVAEAWNYSSVVVGNTYTKLYFGIQSYLRENQMLFH